MAARYAGRDHVLGVVPIAACCAGCAPMRVWSAHAAANPKEGDRSAEPAHAADRCARAITALLAVLAVRLRRLMGRPFGRWAAWLANRFSWMAGMIPTRPWC